MAVAVSPSFRALFIAATLLAAAGIARADAGDTLNLKVAETMVVDNNLFRLPSGVDPSALTGNAARSDRISIDNLSLSVDKQYSLQTLHLDASLAKYRYATYSFLDFTALNESARWNWAATPRLTGKLSADRQQSINSFADFRNISQRNVKTSTRSDADFDYWLAGAWHLTAAGFRNRTSNEVVYVQGGDVDYRGGQIGLRYLAANADYINTLVRYSRGVYPNSVVVPASLIDDAFRQVDQEMQWQWTLSGHSQLKGRITHLEREHGNFAIRDYRGTAGRLDYDWTPTGKILVLVTAQRDYDTYQAANASYFITDTLSVIPAWQATAKTLLKLKLDRIARMYQGSPGLVAGSRSDKQRSALLSFEWTPTRALTFAVTAQRDLRRSTAPGFDYDDSTVTLTAQFAF